MCVWDEIWTFFSVAFSLILFVGKNDFLLQERTTKRCATDWTRTENFALVCFVVLFRNCLVVYDTGDGAMRTMTTGSTMIALALVWDK